MRAFLTCAVLTVTTLTVSTTPASAHPSQNAELVDNWYHRYLRRHGDPTGLAGYTRALRHGTPANVVEAEILSSQEYYHRVGCTPEGYVAALFRDVLGRRPCSEELIRYVRQVQRHGRTAVALQILDQRVVAYAAPVAPVTVVAPAPVYVQPAPVVVTPAVVVPHHHHHRHSPPVAVDPRPSISIRFNVR